MSRLSLIAVSVSRGRRPILTGVSATFAPGRLCAVIGPNGAGKSTLLEVAAGLLSPDAGELHWGDRAVKAIVPREWARARGYLPQNPRVDWPITVEAVIELGLAPFRSGIAPLTNTMRADIDAAIERFALAPLRRRPATQLSGGELARAMLARATVGRPQLLIVDEPTAGLDPRHAIEAGRQLRALADDGCAVVAALHDLDLAARIADDIVALKDGRCVAAGPIDAVFTEAMLSTLYDVDVRIVDDERGRIIRFDG